MAGELVRAIVTGAISLIGGALVNAASEKVGNSAQNGYNKTADKIKNKPKNKK